MFCNISNFIHDPTGQNSHGIFTEMEGRKGQFGMRDAAFSVQQANLYLLITVLGSKVNCFFEVCQGWFGWWRTFLCLLSQCWMKSSFVILFLRLWCLKVYENRRTPIFVVRYTGWLCERNSGWVYWGFDLPEQTLKDMFMSRKFWLASFCMQYTDLCTRGLQKKAKLSGERMLL